MIQYGLDDAEDNVANYLILSLQTEQIVPQLMVKMFKTIFLQVKNAHCPATSIVKIFMPIEVIHLILTARKNGFGKVVSDNLLMEGKFSYFNFNVLQCKKLAYFCKF